ncbi:serine/threonine-protein kinase [Kitasatospora purpeofusca]|uniref:serine/threonine-protein kinase n=1 Tax=Kitasatospora purpeofusca TaxID=67352 RepID=UPI0035E01CA1
MTSHFWSPRCSVEPAGVFPFLYGAVALVPGTLLNGRYKVIRELGKGGMGEIFVGRDTLLGREVAIKVQTARTFESTDDYVYYNERMDRECNRMRDVLEIRGIPRVFDEGRIGRSDRRFLVMELVGGVTLAEWIEMHEPVPVAAVASVLAQLCEILGRLHEKGYVHCDVTPGNVMIQSDGCVRLLDVGISTAVGGLNTEPCGSPYYAPPEQYMPDEVLTAQVDVFPLGVLLFRMAAGEVPYAGIEHPFDGTERAFPLGLRAVMPDDLRALGLTMVALDPKDRPRVADELPGYLRPMLPAFGSAAAPKATKPDPTAYYRRGLWRL